MPSYLEVCEQAARAGGAVLLDWRNRITAREKGPRDLVTEADLASQQAIADVIHAAFPEHGLLGEENLPGHDRQTGGENGYRWIVDPLDGTVNYVHGMANFSVSVALEHNRRIVAAVVYDPVAEECYAATPGAGATLNGQPIATSDCRDMNEALVAVSFSAGVAADSREVRRFVEVLARCQAIRRLGSAALNLCYTAAGRLDAYWADSVKIWDVAAGVLIVTEAGGVLTHLSGGEYQPDDPKVVAACGPAIHEQLLLALRAAEDSR